jgi:hypothetical protein
MRAALAGSEGPKSAERTRWWEDVSRLTWAAEDALGITTKE